MRPVMFCYDTLGDVASGKQALVMTANSPERFLKVILNATVVSFVLRIERYAVLNHCILFSMDCCRTFHP